jgi:hypothetical protein
MRIAALIFGLLGAAGALFLGIKWQGDLSSQEGQAAMKLAAAFGKSELGSEMLSMQRGTYALLICGVVGLIVSFVVLLRKGHRVANGALLVICGILPVLLVSKAVFGVPLALAGLFAFAVKPKAALA